MVKGVSEVITIVLLLIITVAVAGSGYIYISGFANTLTSKAFLMTGIASCDQNGNSTLFIRNAGQGNIDITPVSGDTLILRTGGSGTPTYSVTPAGGVLAPGQSGTIAEILNGCGSAGQATCIYSVTVGGSTQQARADCNPIPPTPTTCPNGVIDSGEVCDGTLFGGQDCSTYGCTGGSLTCVSCTSIDISQCTGCQTPDFGIQSISRDTVTIQNLAGSPLLQGSLFTFSYDGQAITALTAPDVPAGGSSVFSLRDSQLSQTRQVADLVVTYTPASGPAVTRTLTSADFYSADDVAYWNFEGASYLNDLSGNGRNLFRDPSGALSITQTVAGGGQFGQGLAFGPAGGDDTYVATNSPVLYTGDFTIQLWFWPDPAQAETTPTLISLRNTQVGFLGTDARAGPGYIEFNSNTAPDDSDVGTRFNDISPSGCAWVAPMFGPYSFLDSTPSVWEDGNIQLGAWNHIAVTYQASTRNARLFINGNLVESGIPVQIADGTTQITGTCVGPAGNDIFIGLLPTPDSVLTDRDHYVGVVDEVRILDVVRPMT